MIKRNPVRDDIVHAPHPPLTSYYRTEADRRNWLRRIFDDTAPDYDRIEWLVGFGSGSWYRRQALLRAGLGPGMETLDVGVGTGLVAREAVRIVGDPAKVTGIDPSPGMLKSAQVQRDVRLLEGRAECIPLADNSIDFLSMGYALRHIADLSVAFKECFRVLRPGGRLCILEITRPEGKLASALLKAYLHGVVPTFAKLTARHIDTSRLWHYYWDTIEACASAERVMGTLESAGFANVDRVLGLGIFSEYRGQKPVEQNRAGAALSAALVSSRESVGQDNA
jgi:demethylmenaquinone methyltransferase / 2-methoxy-6-polyprenyl-1,4-benzoquinol methylase